MNTKKRPWKDLLFNRCHQNSLDDGIGKCHQSQTWRYQGATVGRFKKSVDADKEKAFTNRVPASLIFFFHICFLGAALACHHIVAMLPR